MFVPETIPWVAAIPLGTFALRTAVTFPFSVANRLRARRQAELQPILSAMTPLLKAKLASTGKLDDPEKIEILAIKERRRRRIELYRKFKCQNWKMLALPAVQVPLWMSVSYYLRDNLKLIGAAIDETGQPESLLWINDLTLADPTSLLPMALGAVSMLNAEWTYRQINAVRSTSSRLPKAIGNVSKIGTLCFMAIALQQPAALCLYWLASNVYSFIQNVVLDYYLPIKPSR